MTDLPSLWQQQLMCSWWEITACLFRLPVTANFNIWSRTPPPRPKLRKHQSPEKADCCAASQSNKRTSVALDAEEGPQMPETVEVTGIEGSLWKISLVFYKLNRHRVFKTMPNKHCRTIISVLHASFNVIVPSTTRSSKRSLSFRVPPYASGVCPAPPACHAQTISSSSAVFRSECLLDE